VYKFLTLDFWQIFGTNFKKKFDFPLKKIYFRKKIDFFLRRILSLPSTTFCFLFVSKKSENTKIHK